MKTKNRYTYNTKGGFVSGDFNIYQARTGAVMLLMGVAVVKLTFSQINDLGINVYDLIDFDYEDFMKYYNQNQVAAVQAEQKPIEAYEYPHMKYGLPRHYAVHFEAERSGELKTKAIKRYNEIHNTTCGGVVNFYGFDGEVNYWSLASHFDEPVTILTVIKFLTITNNHFNSHQK